MLLYNQIRQPLSWDARGQVYNWEPFGSCTVPDDLLPHIRSQKVPVDVAPIAPEIKASAIVDEQREAERGDTVFKLRAALTKAEAEASVAKATVEDAEKGRAEAELATKEAKSALREEQARSTQFQADLRAAEQLLAEAMRKLDKFEAVQKVSDAIDADATGRKTPRRG